MNTAPDVVLTDKTREKIVRMANQIAGFFATQAEATQVNEVADHIRAFWDPAMRAQLARHLAEGGTGLSPLARAAAERLGA